MKIELRKTRKLFNNESISVDTEIRQWNAGVGPETLYASETLTMTVN